MTKKKNKRPNLSQETLERARAEMRGTAEPLAPTSTDAITARPTNGTPATSKAGVVTAPVAPKLKTARSAPGLAVRRIPSLEELLANYRYVLRDLRKLALIAVLLLLIIVAAAVFLPPLGG